MAHEHEPNQPPPAPTAAGRTSAYEALWEMEKNWEETFDAIPDPVSVHDTTFTVRRVNRAFAELFHTTPDRLVGCKCYELFHGGDGPIAGCPHQHTLETGDAAREEIFEPSLNAYLDVSTAPVVNARGEITGSVHIARDITELKKVEALKDEFIGLVSHELRHPLTIIAGSLATALSPKIEEEDRRELMLNAVEATAMLGVTLNNMIELSRHQAGRLELSVAGMGLVSAVPKVVELLERQGVRRRFVLDVPDDLPEVRADENRVEQVLFNLMENAAKYSPEPAEIRVSARREDGFVVVAVADEGKGITPQEQERLFQPFERLKEAGGQSRGLGLGLVVCKHLVEAHGGWIDVTSDPGRGTTFRFALPVSGDGPTA